MIKCDIHDYIEIACLYKIEVLLTQHSGEEEKGVASTTSINSDKQELLHIIQGDHRLAVVLDTIKNMKALTPNPHFSSVDIY
ncbi:Rho-binding antiterminator [Shewanella sp. D64]|uniref:Rho-binding antiterminator n=1 Tax=unclassified Shewanella TaxID=196818 RepID=UPI0022BA1359|nr:MULTISPECIES: Rho-binding antiterminator [unclassified Shewanella]MEC4727391.1 Rho-binding antiterminator [Shewanella sp. D64]MEC4739546.1 Rho-binding antiterminator [Shewanella sp. E94]WBJ96071.1 Rho-binding antiterminator [Shewanella sp. MTB7]